MAYNALNNLIDAYIYANGVQAITGQILNGVLKQMVSQLGSGYHLMGVAGPATVPASNDYAMAYFAATAGEYTDFGGITLTAGEVAVLLTSGNGSWAKQTVYNVPTGTADLENTANFITNAVTDLVNYYTKEETDTTLANYPTLEALATALADYYTKTEIDTTLADYATKDGVDETLADYYDKDEVDAEMGDRYTKSEVDTKLADYYKKTETYDKDEVDSIVAALSRQEYIVAWDGLAAPDVSAIPAGVTVTYSGTTFTGTLAASASTVNKIYMVWNGTAYDMYGTSQDGGYSWVPMGTTSVDLSQYATKAELGQLQQEVTADISQLEHKVDGNPRNYTPGEYLKNDGTTTTTTNLWAVTDYIPYTPGNDVLWRFSDANRSYYLGFYRADKTYISGSEFTAQYNSTNQGRLIAKASINSYAPNAAYLRASFSTTYADAQIKVGDTVVWTPKEKEPSLQEQIDALAEFNEDIFADCLVEQIKLVGVAYQGKYIYKGDNSINDSASNGSFVVPVTTGDRILIRGTVNAFANYTVIGFTDNLTNGYTAGVKNLLTVDSNTNPYTYTYLFTATADGYLMAWTTKQGYGNSLYVEMFRIKERQKEVFDRYLPETVKLQTFGDSITDNFWGDKSSWVSYVPDNIKNTTLTIVNSAVGGASIGGTGSYNIPNQIENGYTRTDGSVAAPLDSTADIVVIFAGTNDWAAGHELASTLGNLATAFQYIYEHSKAKVLFCTPLQRYNDADQARDTDANGVPVNSLGMTLRELCDDLIEVCKRFSVPVLDLNAEANINRYNISDYSLDGLHPQRWGDAYLSRIICEKIKAMLRYDLQ